MRSRFWLPLALPTGVLLAACGAGGGGGVLPVVALTPESPPTVQYVKPSRATTPPPTTITVRRPVTTRTVTLAPANPAPGGLPQTSTATPASAAPERTSGVVTFYSALDKSPLGSLLIAFPTILHGLAGGSGSYEDPVTFAAAPYTFKPGTRIYVPDLQRYFVLEDLCASCGGTHIELWTGSALDDGIKTCAAQLGAQETRSYLVDPPQGLPVKAGPLYDGGACFSPQPS